MRPPGRSCYVRDFAGDGSALGRNSRSDEAQSHRGGPTWQGEAQDATAPKASSSKGTPNGPTTDGLTERSPVRFHVGGRISRRPTTRSGPFLSVIASPAAERDPPVVPPPLRQKEASSNLLRNYYPLRLTAMASRYTATASGRRRASVARYPARRLQDNVHACLRVILHRTTGRVSGTWLQDNAHLPQAR